MQEVIKVNKNETNTFYNSEFGNIRTVMVDGQPMFVAQDVIKTLGYNSSNGDRFIHRHINQSDYTTVRGGGVARNKSLVLNESALYALILKSNSPKAQKFQHWVTSDVLPSIRKTGMYMNNQTMQKVLEDPDLIITLIQQLRDERKASKELQDALKERNNTLQKENEALTLKINTIKSALQDLFDINNTIPAAIAEKPKKIKRTVAINATTTIDSEKWQKTMQKRHEILFDKAQLVYCKYGLHRSALESDLTRYFSKNGLSLYGTVKKAKIGFPKCKVTIFHKICTSEELFSTACSYLDSLLC